ncbi:Valine--tRNA ligase [Frankliniella fusca]|uniref:Valine--tRNA ligase n=1 Tax=Frankliniella fusca TaxID=407009 RepID=A0AAE1HXT6_9NEOP|nr:Valine--tRNA ligase [Frankliniella fusca]KAK3931035.1 Valine--tRNA ligase [Frankliniella fusca]
MEFCSWSVVPVLELSLGASSGSPQTPLYPGLDSGSSPSWKLKMFPTKRGVNWLLRYCNNVFVRPFFGALTWRSFRRKPNFNPGITSTSLSEIFVTQIASSSGSTSMSQPTRTPFITPLGSK